MPRLFAYGTLQFPQIVKRITGKTFPSSEARLPGYRRYSVKGADYPAIYKDSRSEVSGVLLKGVDDESLKRIIQFEGDDYQMQEVMIYGGNEKVKAITFVWCGDLKSLDENDWDCDLFESKSLNLYK